ncbi:nuclear transport factor 2 family protein [Cyclobacterium plantarum]|uniref:SnoaL-like domain-containing protein n=1 Tax=Cyclobacterium plantarum TaxID=2716263 RepID=A0ABX0HEM3_9BACT|nr:nuclear transport factor 2 family protein [Cyclobacterium plantarum]NHE58621.1 SnoaL-like domain-containing protein [Cyclobacterium plantarum]
MNMNTADLLEIQNLIATYTIATDNKDVAGFMNCWVGPEEFEGYDSGAFGHLKTWEELRDFEAHHVGEGGDANGKRHQATNIIIQPLSETEVSVTHDMIVLEVAAIPMVIATGRYNNSKVVKTDKGWKFKWRKLDIDSGFFKLMEQWQQQA